MKGTNLPLAVLLFTTSVLLAKVKSSAIGQRSIMGVAESNVHSLMANSRNRRSDESDSGSSSESNEISESVSSEESSSTSESVSSEEQSRKRRSGESDSGSSSDSAESRIFG
ncbi:uncharacterized protein LOC110445372 isoform X1 [Mizuhopecten yessoensis]|uniref:uncharacterized protein LOC110445372 isoform X1 n=1 Tax=Mizuhopecten yessoensis TaxID=6573 RepID=UPI000B45D87A|nr:uncharacterized protein LOC110445372 isoform X1 [Mizuhopecten yessoensis]